MLVSKTLPQEVAILVFVPQNPLQGLQFLLIPPESPPPFQSTEIAVLRLVSFTGETNILNNYESKNG